MTCNSLDVPAAAMPRVCHHDQRDSLLQHIDGPQHLHLDTLGLQPLVVHAPRLHDAEQLWSPGCFLQMCTLWLYKHRRTPNGEVYPDLGVLPLFPGRKLKLKMVHAVWALLPGIQTATGAGLPRHEYIEFSTKWVKRETLRSPANLRLSTLTGTRKCSSQSHTLNAAWHCGRPSAWREPLQWHELALDGTLSAVRGRPPRKSSNLAEVAL